MGGLVCGEFGTLFYNCICLVQNSIIKAGALTGELIEAKSLTEANLDKRLNGIKQVLGASKQIWVGSENVS